MGNVHCCVIVFDYQRVPQKLTEWIKKQLEGQSPDKEMQRAGGLFCICCGAQKERGLYTSQCPAVLETFPPSTSNPCDSWDGNIRMSQKITIAATSVAAWSSVYPKLGNQCYLDSQS